MDKIFHGITAKQYLYDEEKNKRLRIPGKIQELFTR